MTKTCKELFGNIDCTIIGDETMPVEGIAFRSDHVHPGDAFFCIVGLVSDGHTYAQDAINRGAKVIVEERNLILADATDVTTVVVKDSRKALAQASAAFYDNPSNDLEVVGVTGTNGKTTTTYLVQHILQFAKKKCGILGTVGLILGNQVEKTGNTTPESLEFQRLLAKTRNSGYDSIVAEVSSHALDLHRVWSTKFAVTAFTNLTQDHLDYHHTFGEYFNAKARLFSPDYPAKRVICIDDSWGEKLATTVREQGDELITTGFNESADITPVSVDYAQTHTHVVLAACGSRYEFDYPLVGRFNVSNMMTAFGIALSLGIAPETIIEALEDKVVVPGRLQRVNVENDGGISVYVDYAHTPDALEKALSAVKAITKGKTIVVFGCGGDRDKTKRPLMGRAACAADYVVVTSDNPRSEDPARIIEDILPGIREASGSSDVEPDRRLAIAKAISVATRGDSILIAGKGHEDYQLVGNKVLAFDDSVVAAEELQAAFGAAAANAGEGGSANAGVGEGGNTNSGAAAPKE